MKKLILGLCSILVLSIIVFSACNKKEVIPKSSTNNMTLTTDPPSGEDGYILSELNHYLDGSTSTLSAVNDAKVIQSVFHEDYDNTTMYHFTTNEAFNTWVEGKPFETQLVRRNYVVDSLSETGNENDTSGYSSFESKIPNRNGGFDKITNNSKRVSLGGARLCEHCDLAVCGGSIGNTKTIAAWHRNLGWINNRATQIDHYGAGWNTWCTENNFRGERLSLWFAVTRKAYLNGLAAYNDNIQSNF